MNSIGFGIILPVMPELIMAAGVLTIGSIALFTRTVRSTGADRNRARHGDCVTGGRLAPG